MNNNFISTRPIIVDKKFILSITEKLQFYRMNKCLLNIVCFVAILLSCSTSIAQNGYVKFVKPNDTVPEWIPNARYYVETYNPTNDTFRCVVAVVIDSTTATPVLDLNAGNRNVMVPPGATHIDSFPLEIIDDLLYDPFERIAFKIVNLSNPSFLTADSFASVYILDNDPFSISFIGAGKSIVEQDTTFLLRIALNGLVSGSTSVKVALDLSNTTKGKDFDFKDTIITINAFSFDTFYVPVVVFDDTIQEANEQVNFTLSDATNGAIIDIAAFTLTIVDNDLQPSRIQETMFSNLKTYPNPAVDFITLDGLNEIADWQVMNPIGEVLLREKTSNYPASIQLNSLPNGMYFLTGNNGKEFVKRTFVKQ
jgi:hypothetical protein